MSEAGLDDLMLAYPPIGEAKARRLRAVLERARVSVSLDSEEAVATTGRAADGARIPVFVEIDLGARRCGVPPGPEAVRLARLIESTPGLDFEGLMFYPGHVHPDFDGNSDTLEKLAGDLQRLLELFAAEKFPVPRISGGSTPSAPIATWSRVWTKCVQGPISSTTATPWSGKPAPKSSAPPRCWSPSSATPSPVASSSTAVPRPSPTTRWGRARGEDMDWSAATRR